MKKILFGTLLMTSLILTGCGEEYQDHYLSEQISSKTVQLHEKEDELQDLNNKINADKNILVKKGNGRYIITVQTGQSHFSLDITDHIKDKANTVTYDIAVDETYYNSVNIGDNICDEFRAGSFITSGSIGSWDIKVKDKRIEIK